MLRHHHYEVAFEAWLRAQRIAYVAVDETRRALLQEGTLKSPDFLVEAAGVGKLIVDVKGRQYPARGQGQQAENWALQDDITSLLGWQTRFGTGFVGVLAFAYDLQPGQRGMCADFSWRGHDYAFFGVRVDEFQAAMRVRSRAWETVWLPAAEYRRVRFPLRELFTTACSTAPGSIPATTTAVVTPVASSKVSPALTGRR